MDLSGANLHGADLRGVDLTHADLNKADLGGAQLSLTELSYANLCGADLSGAILYNVDLFKTDLTAANLNGAQLCDARLRANLTEAKLVNANLSGTQILYANLNRADLSGANLASAKITDSDFGGANLTGAMLAGASLIRTNFEQAILTDCDVYGVSVWGVRLDGAIQSNLSINNWDEALIQVDHLEVAQFVYLLLNNQKIREVIDTITSKVVLILGRFTPERKEVLNRIRDELRKRNYLPVLFDCQKPDSKDLTGTVTTLANLARFIIADLTDPSSIPYELARIVPGTKVPVQAIILDGQREFAMFNDLLDYRWVLPPYRYQSAETLMANLNDVIAPAEAKAKELIERNKGSA